MKAVSNASPLLFLGKISRLPLLDRCFDAVYVPPAVVSETQGLELPPTIIKRDLSAEGKAFVQGAIGRLHAGELEAMRLASEFQADFVLLDDLAARQKAYRMGLRVMGTVGVLLLSNQQGYIASREVVQALDTLVTRHNLYLSIAIRKQIEDALR